MSLWSLLSAPLLLSCDISSLDEFTLSLLTNDDVLEVNQDPLGAPARRIVLDEYREAWAKIMEDGALAVGLFNKFDESLEIEVTWKDLGLNGAHQVRNLWRQKDISVEEKAFTTVVAPHGVALLKFQSKIKES
jgi:alpha-galactosidase